MAQRLFACRSGFKNSIIEYSIVNVVCIVKSVHQLHVVDGLQSLICCRMRKPELLVQRSRVVQQAGFRTLYIVITVTCAPRPAPGFSLCVRLHS